jgi:hypothetical protein
MLIGVYSMFATFEVRWFGAGATPDAVAEWFAAAPEAAAPPPRVDHYLRLPDDDSLGIKLREGRVEVKQRQGEKETAAFHARVTGAVAHWRKWSFPLVEGVSGLAEIAETPRAWLAVQKARRLRSYALDAAGEITAVSPQDPPPQGCDWELTAVRLNGRPWWTVGFEAYGPDPAAILHRVVAHLLAAYPPPPLTLDQSWSYPAWLRQGVSS